MLIFKVWASSLWPCGLSISVCAGLCYITQDFMQLLFSASAFIAHSICTLRALLSLTGASWECSSSGVSLTGLGRVCHPSSRVSHVCSCIVILFDCLFISDSFLAMTSVAWWQRNICVTSILLKWLWTKH